MWLVLCDLWFESPSSPPPPSCFLTQDSNRERIYTRSSRPSFRCVCCGAAAVPRAANQSATRSLTRSSPPCRTSWSLPCATASYSSAVVRHGGRCWERQLTERVRWATGTQKKNKMVSLTTRVALNVNLQERRQTRWKLNHKTPQLCVCWGSGRPKRRCRVAPHAVAETCFIAHVYRRLSVCLHSAIHGLCLVCCVACLTKLPQNLIKEVSDMFFVNSPGISSVWGLW